MEYFEKNPPNWSNDEIIKELISFKELYKKRPIKKNVHGMMLPHMFATHFILKKIKPKFVIESGVYKGQSTWLIENTLPKCEILSIDIDLSQREYISKKADYSNLDFKMHNFSRIPNETLVFFDDHVSHLERIQQAKFFNIKNIIFEDNYATNEGDFYTIKHSYQNSGFNHRYTILSQIKTTYLFLTYMMKKIFNKNYYFPLNKITSRIRDHYLNPNDFKNIEKIIDIYFEFPPIINNKSGIKEPIFKNLDIDFEDAKDELKSYNYLTYVKLK
tara:strand:- start:219 stop:1037 length:819 start_codon:yes stop_codon:yes gene_type:complete